jgi:ssDNA-binding Zn-finger/Zn-ribbon topoisomerase 1
LNTPGVSVSHYLTLSVTVRETRIASSNRCRPFQGFRMHIPIHAQNFTATATRKRVKNVQCEKCGGTYAYECVRAAKGASSALYGIGAQGAADRAEDRAATRLLRALNDAVDPVPCPDCGLLQGAMVAEMHRRRFRGLKKVGRSCLWRRTNFTASPDSASPAARTSAPFPSPSSAIPQ